MQSLRTQSERGARKQFTIVFISFTFLCFFKVFRSSEFGSHSIGGTSGTGVHGALDMGSGFTLGIGFFDAFAPRILDYRTHSQEIGQDLHSDILVSINACDIDGKQNLSRCS
jgi:hypothetical protein